MKSHPKKISFLFILLATIAPLFGLPRVEAENQEIYVVYFQTTGGTVGAYNTSGGPVNANLVTGLIYPQGVATSGGHVFVVDNRAGTVGEYDGITGAPVNASLISGLVDPSGIAIDDTTLYVTTNLETSGGAKVVEYKTDGTLVNGALITGLTDPEGIAVADGYIYVSDLYTGTVGKYTITGTPVNIALVSGLQEPNGLAVSGSDLYVCSPQAQTIYKYTTTGAPEISWTVANGFPVGLAIFGSNVLVTDQDGYSVREYTSAGILINNALISGIQNPLGIAVSGDESPTPTPTLTPTPTPTPTATPTPTPTVPPHGGLSSTLFTVNGLTIPSANVTDTVLAFAAVQAGTPKGLKVRVQSSVAGGAWTDLANDAMIYDIVTQKYILDTLNYPTFNSISFRAISSAPGYSDSISNVVGAFSLASSKLRLSSPEIAVTGNGPFADLYFRSYVAIATNGIALRVQSSTTPAVETSWTDLNDGKAGHMSQSNAPNRFYLMDNKLPAVTGVYYRVLATLTGYADGLSTPFGPLDLTLDTPPAVAITAPKAISGSGTVSNPFVYNLGSLNFVAKATMPAGGKVQGVGLTADGELFAVSLTPTVTAAYNPATIGDHVIEAIAADSAGGMSRFGTSPTYIRIIPPTTAKKNESSGGDHSEASGTASGKVFTIAKSGGNWNDATTWKDAQGKSGIPGQNDLAIVGSSTVHCPLDVVAGSVTLTGGTIVGPGTLDIYGTITISSGTFVNSFLYVGKGAVAELTNNAPIQFSGMVVNFGAWNIHGGAPILGLTTFANNGTTHFQLPLGLIGTAGVDPTVDTRSIVTTSATNGGLLSSGVHSLLLGSDGSSIISQDGNGIVAQGGGNIVAQGGGNIVKVDPAGIVAQGGGNVINTNGSNIVAQGGGNIVAQGGGNAASYQGAKAESAPSGFVQTGGETDLDGIIITGPVTLDGGVLDGSGLIEGELTNNSGYISPGHGAGVIGVTGSFSQGASGTLILEDGGADPDEFDQLQVADKATLGGNLDLQLINGYKPSNLDTFSPLGYNSISGKFATISSNATVKVISDGVEASVDSTIPGPAAGASRNISTRAFVQTGDNVAIAGFIVTGPAGSNKKVIIRGIGPSLSHAGVSGALADPYLQLFQGGALISSNDNWMTNKAAVMASGLAPTDDLESAIVATLAPGAYTAILSGTNNGTGVGLIEVYDLAADSPASLANISTRCSVQTGDNVLIGGFILQGDEPSQILVRAIGPSLTEVGVTGALADPILDLYDADGDVLENDDWRATQALEIAASTLSPKDSREAAILSTLVPGNYTVVVRGKDDTTGVALVEIYNL